MAVVDWQASLFAGEQPRRSGIEPTRTDLGAGAWLDHAPGWLAGSDTVFEALVGSAPWRQGRRRMYEREVDDPRLTAWWSESFEGLPPILVEIRDELARTYGAPIDSIGCNLYRDGRDSVAWHGDTVRRTQDRSIVGIVSLGSPRRFLLRPLGGGRSRRWELGRGDLLVMGGTCQHTWQHSVPKVASAGPRISVTYRHSQPLP